ncbi:MAG: arginase family protein [Candidatus Aenigmarchaeota archaeon]|nr:arginase family protein [Candidatus Aenigmarchaeota archaeon]
MTEIAIVTAPIITNRIDRWNRGKNRIEFREGPKEFMKHWENNGHGLFDIGQLDDGSGITKDNIRNYIDFYKKLYEQNYTPVTIGGDHSVTVPPMLAAAEVHNVDYARFDRDIDAIDFDENRNPLDYACPFLDEFNFSFILNALCSKPSFLHIGGYFDENSASHNPFDMKIEDHIASAMRLIKKYHKVDFLTEQNKNKHPKLIKNFVARSKRPLYVSVDTDFLGEVPASSYGYTPLTSQMSMKDYESYFKLLSKRKIVGMDICEITNNDKHAVSAKYAAEILKYSLSLIEHKN